MVVRDKVASKPRIIPIMIGINLEAVLVFVELACDENFGRFGSLSQRFFYGTEEIKGVLQYRLTYHFMGSQYTYIGFI